jgi:hypothetical protein
MLPDHVSDAAGRRDCRKKHACQAGSQDSVQNIFKNLNLSIVNILTSFWIFAHFLGRFYRKGV